MNRILLTILFLLLACTPSFAQSSFMGLTPGKSTRADVERVFGRPIQSVSKTLIEYKSPDNVGKLYVQYRDESPAARVERIELSCVIPGGSDNTPCWNRNLTVWDKYLTKDNFWDANRNIRENAGSKDVLYFGPSRFMVLTMAGRNDTSGEEYRWGFYSKELYEEAAPKSVGCTGTIFGDWETNGGRMRVERTGDIRRDDDGVSLKAPIKGTYSTNNGTFTGYLFSFGIIGEWKDNTGTGKMTIHAQGLAHDQLSGNWERKTGTGPAQGKWEGRCVETKSTGND